MRTLVASALLAYANADETSLMQGRVRASGKLTTDTKSSRQESTSKLLETAVNMIKNGVTPDVITFVDSTNAEINEEVLAAIQREHDTDQAYIHSLCQDFLNAVQTLEDKAAEIALHDDNRLSASEAHQNCRKEEALACAHSRRCEEQLRQKWVTVKHEESIMREIHGHIHDEWCIHPPFFAEIDVWLTNPFNWADMSPYPILDLPQDVRDFRQVSVTHFNDYMAQKIVVERAWHEYNEKLVECSGLEEALEEKVPICDQAQITLREHACQHAVSNREAREEFGQEWDRINRLYDEAVIAKSANEQDRKNEWETLKIVQCLLDHVHSTVVDSIETGAPCPTIDSDEEGVTLAIEDCHIVTRGCDEGSMTAHLCLEWCEKPPIPPLPPVEEPACTPAYIAREQGAFLEAIQASYNEMLSNNGDYPNDALTQYNTVLSPAGWAGCAAPLVCVDCAGLETVLPVPTYENAPRTCHLHEEYLAPGQSNFDSFRCLDGTCIGMEGRCNGYANCGDESDEMGCDAETEVFVPAYLAQSIECPADFLTDVYFQCANSRCVEKIGLCNGHDNCGDNSDEAQCSGSIHVTTEATSGRTITVETLQTHTGVFHDREYSFDSLGDFAGKPFIKYSNDDKATDHAHVMTKLRTEKPLTVFIVKLEGHSLPWLEGEGYAPSAHAGLSFSGVRETRHKEWDPTLLTTDTFTASQVYSKTFAAGTISIPGNNNGDGGFLVFLAEPGFEPQRPVIGRPVEAHMAIMGTYPGYSGDLHFTGGVSVSEDWSGNLLLSWNLRGLEAELCRTAPAGVANACGIHVHSGTTCDDASGVGGHYYHASMASDPWSPVVYTPDAHGASTRTGYSLGIGHSLSDVVGRAIVVHDHTGARVACGIVGAPPPPQPIYAAPMSAYPGYSGNLHFTGSVSVTEDPSNHNLLLSWHLGGLEAELCRTAPAGVANACGIHVHSGTTCDDASGVGGHYYHASLPSDPWSPVVYTPDAHGESTRTGYSLGIGHSLSDVVGRAIVVHDHTGGRVACGIVAPPPPPPVYAATMSSYPGYSGNLNFIGSVSVTEDPSVGNLLLSWHLSGLEAELCRQAPAGVANACGIHVHSGTTCDDASGVGGHYFHDSMPSDPWSPVVYTPDARGNSARTGYNLDIGHTLSDVVGRAIVVHDHTGGRVACGIVEPLPDMSHLMVQGCNNSPRELEPADGTASLRCCSQDGTSCNSGYFPETFTFLNGLVSTGSACENGHCRDVPDTFCHRELTHTQAAEICAANGERLCTRAEIESDVCCGNGCGHNAHLIWITEEVPPREPVLVPVGWSLPTDWDIQASSLWSVQYEPNRVKEVDGTPWHSRNNNFPEHMTFDAGRSVTMNGFATAHPNGWGGSAMRDYTFSRSDDGVTWTEVTSGVGTNLRNHERMEVMFPVVSARYWKLDIASNHGYHRLVTIQYIEFHELRPEEVPVCCEALTAECLACSAQLSVDNYCGLHPNTQGCVSIMPVDTHRTVLVSWPEHAWGPWREGNRGGTQEKCLPKDATEDPDGTGFLFTSCCSNDGMGLNRQCGTTRNTNFETAERQCADQGGRLCTVEESLALDASRGGIRATATRGCSVDGPPGATGGDLNRHWTSTPCSPNPPGRGGCWMVGDAMVCG